MRNRLRFGEWVAGLSALGLWGFLFLEWFAETGIARAQAGEGWTGYAPLFAGASGWESLGWLALGFCILAILAGLALPVVFALYESPVLPMLAAILAMLLGGLAVIALLVQVVFQPGPDELVMVRSGWWLGLLAAAGVARGGFVSLRDEYLPGVPLPDVELRPAPPAAPAA